MVCRKKIMALLMFNYWSTYICCVCVRVKRKRYRERIMYLWTFPATCWFVCMINKVQMPYPTKQQKRSFKNMKNNRFLPLLKTLPWATITNGIKPPPLPMANQACMSSVLTVASYIWQHSLLMHMLQPPWAIPSPNVPSFPTRDLSTAVPPSCNAHHHPHFS